MTAKMTATLDRFVPRLLLIGFVGLAIRMVWIVAERHSPMLYDGNFYFALADAIRHGRGFIDPYVFDRTGQAVANANHTPAWPLLLTIPRVLGWNSLLPSQIFAGLVGTLTVVVMGLAGRAAAGARTGLTAAAIAALYPSFWVYERELMSETLALLLLALTMLVAYRYYEHAGLRWSAGLGALCGLLALTHPNYLLLIPLLAAPLVLRTPHAGRRRRFRQLAVTAVVATVVVVPWIAYNAGRFDKPVYMTTALGLTLVDGNCPAVYSGTRLGSWEVLCARPLPRTDDAAVRDATWRHRAQNFVDSHLGRLPVVIAAREGRTWAVFRPLQQNHFDAAIGSSLWVERLRLFSYWLMAPFAIAGAVLFRRRGISLVPPLALVLVVFVTVAFSFGDTRYRAPAEVAIVLLAAAAFAAIGPREAHAA